MGWFGRLGNAIVGGAQKIGHAVLCIGYIWQKARVPAKKFTMSLILSFACPSRFRIGDCSLGSKKATVGHKNFSFCEQTLHKGLIDD
jgi:hypothetical protein